MFMLILFVLLSSLHDWHIVEVEAFGPVSSNGNQVGPFNKI